MKRKEKQPLYHDESREKDFDPQKNDGQGINEDHNLFMTGSVLGKRINTNSYSSRYERKKGMRFFLFAIILIFAVSVLFLVISPYPDLVVIYANDNEIIMHEVDVNLFRKYKLKAESSFDYDYEELRYGKLEGKAAQLAVLSLAHDADIVVSDKETLLKMGLEDFFISHDSYTGRRDSAVLLRHDLFENDYDLLYGLDFDGVSFANVSGADGLSIISKNRKTGDIVIALAKCLMNDDDYTAGRVK